MIEDIAIFKGRYEQAAHDWKALRKLNSCVNGAIGVDMFDTSVFPCELKISDDQVELITPLGNYSAAAEEFDAEEALKLLEAAVHDSERG